MCVSVFVGQGYFHPNVIRRWVPVTDGLASKMDEPGWKLWILLEANRRLLAFLLTVGVFIAIVLIGTLAPAPLRELVVLDRVTDRLFQALTTSLITGVTIVVTINQLVLSQEIGAVVDQRSRMEGSLKFRSDLEVLLDEPMVPAGPADIFQRLADAVEEGARRFEEEAIAAGVEEPEITAFVGRILERTDYIDEQLEDATFGRYDVLSPVLGFDYSAHIAEADQISGAYGSELGLDARATLTGLTRRLKFFGLAREHFKTLYFQWELVDLSRSVLYLFVPALIVSMSMMVFLDPQAVPAGGGPIDGLLLLVALATAISLSPFLLVVSYVLRVATVAKRTLAIGPFVLHGTDDDE